MTRKTAWAELKAIGVRLDDGLDGELRISVRGNEDTAYYTNDIDDAVATGRKMAAEQTGRTQPFRCDQCEALMINGVFCHERGCPNAKKTWMPEREEWVRFLNCAVCDSEVEEGEQCDCQDDDGEETGH